MTRTKYFAQNVKWKVLFVVASSAMNMLNRYIFMHWMGAEYLGISGLFSSVLGVLSFADLGLSGAFSFCFYQAIAQRDDEHCSVLITSLEKLLNGIAVGMLVVGIALTPFIPLIVTGNDAVDTFHLRLYYVLFLLDMVNGYLFMARTCYVTARQKEFLTMPITTGFSIGKVLAGIVCILVTRNYTIYLCVSILIGFVQRIVLNRFICKRFPEAKRRVKGKLKEDELASIRRNVKAAVVNKLAGISVLQTDNILMSIGVGIVTTGFVSNYVSIKMLVMSVISNIENSLTPSMGNVIATESKERQLEIFYKYVSLNTALISMSFVLLTVLSSPFIELLFGAEAVVPFDVVAMMNLSILFMYSTYALNILPSAAGMHNVGLSMVWVEGISNLVFSILAMQRFGLLGVYIGTVLAELTVYVWKPFIVMRKLYAVGPIEYFKITGRGIVIGIVLGVVLSVIKQEAFYGLTGWMGFFLFALFSTVTCIIGYTLFHLNNRWYRAVLLAIKQYISKLAFKN